MHFIPSTHTGNLRQENGGQENETAIFLSPIFLSQSLGRLFPPLFTARVSD